MILFLGEDKYGSVYVYSKKVQYKFGPSPLFKYENYMPLNISYQEAVERSNDVLIAYEIAKHNSGMCSGDVVREQQITK